MTFLKKKLVNEAFDSKDYTRIEKKNHFRIWRVIIRGNNWDIYDISLGITLARP